MQQAPSGNYTPTELNAVKGGMDTAGSIPIRFGTNCLSVYLLKTQMVLSSRIEL